jgi:predicted ferric reductase
MPQSTVERTQVFIKTLLGTRSDWRLTKPTLPRAPQFNSTWIGPAMAIITICVGWFAFPNTIGDGNAAFALFIGAVSIMMMTWSNLLSTRALPLEQIFGGVDRMYVWHRWLGALSVGAMWLHIEMTDDIKGIRGASRDIADAAEDLAETGSTLLYILVGISLLRWLPTRWWRFTHKLLVLPYAFACWHFYTATKPYANNSFWGSWFTGFMFLGLAAWVYRVVWRDMVRKGKLHRVSHIEQSGNVITIELEPVGTPLKYELGQFAFLTVKVPGLREPHPFTIASSPDELCLRFVIRDLGDWTHRLINSLAVNDRVVVEGAYGRLAPMPHHSVDHVVWIAGGVGITPFLGSAISQQSDDGPTPHLFYCVPSRSTAPAIATLEQAAQEGRIHLHVHASDEKNRIHPDHVLAATGASDLESAHIVMCGPDSLVKSMKSGLRRHRARHSHVEGFDIRSGIGPDMSRYIDDVVRTQLSRFTTRT